MRLAAVIMATHHELHERYGSRRLWRELRRRGIDCGRHRMDRLRREQGLCTRRRRRFMRARAAYQRTPAAPRLCTWPFAAHAPDRLWVGDMTVLPTREGPLYFAALVDACSRRVIGWAMDDHQRLDLTERALEMALQQRRPKPGLLLHHDRGSQYTGARYRAKAEAAKIQLSMSRPGLPYDNAMENRGQSRLSRAFPKNSTPTPVFIRGCGCRSDLVLWTGRRMLDLRVSRFFS